MADATSVPSAPSPPVPHDTPDSAAKAVALVVDGQPQFSLPAARAEVPERRMYRPWHFVVYALVANCVVTALVVASVKYGSEFWTRHWGDVGNVVGIVVSLGGFYLTIRAASNA